MSRQIFPLIIKKVESLLTTQRRQREKVVPSTFVKLSLSCAQGLQRILLQEFGLNDFHPKRFGPYAYYYYHVNMSRHKTMFAKSWGTKSLRINKWGVIRIDLLNKKIRSMTVLNLIMPITLILPNIILPIVDLAVLKLKAHTMSIHICLKSPNLRSWGLKQSSWKEAKKCDIINERKRKRKRHENYRKGKELRRNEKGKRGFKREISNKGSPIFKEWTNMQQSHKSVLSSSSQNNKAKVKEMEAHIFRAGVPKHALLGQCCCCLPFS